MKDMEWHHSTGATPKTVRGGVNLNLPGTCTGIRHASFSIGGIDTPVVWTGSGGEGYAHDVEGVFFSEEQETDS